MRFYQSVFAGALGFFCFHIACTSPVETKIIVGQVSAQELYFDHQQKIHLAWSPDSSNIVYETPFDTTISGTPSSIFIYDMQQDTVRNVTPDLQNTRNCCPTFSADSKSIIFSQDDRLFKLSLQIGRGSALTSSNMPPQFNPDVSPNGQLVACDDGQNIYVVSSDSGALKNVSISIPFQLQNPTWSPDGQKLACESDTLLAIFKFENYEIILESTFGGEFRDISWSRQETPPFGSPILFRNNPGIAMINPTTGEIFDAFTLNRNVESFCWAPNGREIAYSTPFTLFRAPLLTPIERK